VNDVEYAQSGVTRCLGSSRCLAEGSRLMGSVRILFFSSISKASPRISFIITIINVIITRVHCHA
jgi:hypothetical protein